jgi:hypothetical protein
MISVYGWLSLKFQVQKGLERSGSQRGTFPTSKQKAHVRNRTLVEEWKGTTRDPLLIMHLVQRRTGGALFNEAGRNPIEKQGCQLKTYPLGEMAQRARAFVCGKVWRIGKEAWPSTRRGSRTNLLWASSRLEKMQKGSHVELCQTVVPYAFYPLSLLVNGTKLGLCQGSDSLKVLNEFTI